MTAQMEVALIIPTFNAGPYLPMLLSALNAQTIAPQQILVIDSSSTDDTRERFTEFGARVVRIDQRDFNHGGTRRAAVDMLPEAKIVVMLTQDAIPESANSISELLSMFENPLVGAAYGRQLPRLEAGPIEQFAREFNYPGQNAIRNFADREIFGFKTVFFSNSFAAYRCDALRSVGGFPQFAFFAEDTIVAARMLMSGWTLAYAAHARVRHSHGYTIAEEFRRYFDIGVSHAQNKWMVDTFGGADSAGARFFLSELLFLKKRAPLLIPSALMRTVAKYVAYKAGRAERFIPRALKRHLSSQPKYWLDTARS